MSKSTKSKSRKSKSAKSASTRGRGRPATELNFKGLGNKNGEFTVAQVHARYAQAKKNVKGSPSKNITKVAITQKLKKMAKLGLVHIAGKLVHGQGRPFTLWKLGAAPEVAAPAPVEVAG